MVDILSNRRYNDRFAKPVRTTQGVMWKCGNCIEKDFQDSILKQAPDSPAARNILAKGSSVPAPSKNSMISLRFRPILAGIIAKKIRCL